MHDGRFVYLTGRKGTVAGLVPSDLGHHQSGKAHCSGERCTKIARGKRFTEADTEYPQRSEASSAKGKLAACASGAG